jgi:hypothetical protein
LKQKDGLLVVAVAAVAVAAVVIGGAIAYQRGPQTETGAAAPLAGKTTPTTAGTPTSTPSIAPTPTPLSQASVKVKLDLSKLPAGRAPQVTYLQGRTVRGGAGRDFTVPGKQNILRATRFNGSLLVILEVGLGGAELARMDDDTTFAPERLPDVQSLVSSLSEDAVAFATAPVNADHTRAKGSVVYWEGSSGRRSLKRPDDWGSTALGVVGDTVFFKSDLDRDGLTSTLSSWDSESGKVTPINSIRSPEGVNYAGTAAVDFVAGAAQTFCSSLTEIGSGKRLWRTCEYAVNGFTPDGGTAIGTPDFRNGGSDPLVAALNSKDGSVRRQWAGAQFVESVAEDDDQLLMVADTGEGTRTAIIRCSIETGACELATGLVKAGRYDVRLLGAWQ